MSESVAVPFARGGLARVLAGVTFLPIAYLVVTGVMFAGEQSRFAEHVEWLLAATVLASRMAGNFRGIKREGVPSLSVIDGWNCEKYADEQCQALCRCLRWQAGALHASGKLAGRKRTLWKATKSLASLGGIALAVTTSPWAIAGIGAALCLPGTLEPFEDGRRSLI